LLAAPGLNHHHPICAQLRKVEKDAKSLRTKLRQAATRLERCQTLGARLQEMGAALVADAAVAAD